MPLAHTTSRRRLRTVRGLSVLGAAVMFGVPMIAAAAKPDGPAAARQAVVSTAAPAGSTIARAAVEVPAGNATIVLSSGVASVSPDGSASLPADVVASINAQSKKLAGVLDKAGVTYTTTTGNDGVTLVNITGELTPAVQKEINDAMGDGGGIAGVTVISSSSIPSNWATTGSALAVSADGSVVAGVAVASAGGLTSLPADVIASINAQTEKLAGVLDKAGVAYTTTTGNDGVTLVNITGELTPAVQKEINDAMGEGFGIAGSTGAAATLVSGSTGVLPASAATPVAP